MTDMYVTDKIMRKIKITSIHRDVIMPGTYFLAGNKCYFMLSEQYHVILKQPLGGTVCIFILCEQNKMERCWANFPRSHDKRLAKPRIRLHLSDSK